MEYSLLKSTKGRVDELKGTVRSHRWRYVCLAGFLVGMLVCVILGRDFVKETGILDVSDLRIVKDMQVEKWDFLRYVLVRRVVWLVAGLLCLRWGYLNWYVYGVMGCMAFVMGACLQICLFQYRLKGLLLWMVLYLPHSVCYLATLLLAVMLATQRSKGGVESMTGRAQYGLCVCIGLMVLAGAYCECYLNVPLLQAFLRYF